MADKSAARAYQPAVSPPEIRDRYDHFGKLLLELRNQVLSRAGYQRKSVDEQILTSPGDVGDASVVDESADYYLSLADHDRGLVGEIRDALGRIRDGTYGVCGSCQFPIDEQRLEKLPYARLCIDCQSAREARYGAGRPSTSRKL